MSIFKADITDCLKFVSLQVSTKKAEKYDSIDFGYKR